MAVILQSNSLLLVRKFCHMLLEPPGTIVEYINPYISQIANSKQSHAHSKLYNFHAKE